MDSTLGVDRLHFAFTITYHYLFPQLTMGLALLILILKTRALRGRGERYDRAARFWTRIFAINFAMGVVTGIPMEFQFGTNWSRFARAAGGVIGQTLAMEGVFSFFLESSFLGALLLGEKRLGPRGHWAAAFLVFLGSWISGFFIVATNAFMQHPAGYLRGARSGLDLDSLWTLLTNPWARWENPHVMLGSVVTASTVMASVGAFYLVSGRHPAHGRTFVRLGVLARLPPALPLLYFAYHVMVGLGTIFIAVLGLAAWRLRGGRLYASRGLLWALMLMLPFPSIANTAGWLTAELGRQPWLVLGLMRTQEGSSPSVSAGNALFTLIGFMGMYTVLSILFLVLVYREIEHGPEGPGAAVRARP